MPSADNWAFQVDWCPRNPDLLATAFFDGTVGIHSIQSTNESSSSKATAHQSDGADIFDAPGFSRSSQGGTLSLKQPPKWLRRPASNAFGFGGRLITVSNLPSVQGKNQSSVVHIRRIVTEQNLVQRATQLQAAVESDSLKAFAEGKAKELEASQTEDGWKALLSLFKANSRDELVTLLGFSKSEIASRVAEAVENLKASTQIKSTEDVMEQKPHSTIVSFAEPERQEYPSEGSDLDEERIPESNDEKTPSEVSENVTSDTASAIRQDGESTTTAPSLFGEDNEIGAPLLDGGHDFFSTVGVAQEDGASLPVHVPHTNYGLDSSVAATSGSRPSSVTSELLKSNSFKIYPADESEIDRLITKALVLGDFESAVSLCLSSDRFADAILLAVRGGPDLLQRTQKAYFEKRTTTLPYLRLFQSIVTNDLADIVQNADLQEWQEIFVVICTFASQEEFSSLAEQLGNRLEFQFTIRKASQDYESAKWYRKNATLTYLAAARLERLVEVWADELLDEEKLLASDEKHASGSLYSAHTHALQTFIEKVTVFRSATNYKDEALSQTTGVEESAKTYKLANLYDRYFEYADLLSTQGLLKEAVGFLKLTPPGYQGLRSVDLSSERERLIAATTAPTSSTSTPAAAPAVAIARTTYTSYSALAQPSVPVPQPTSLAPQPASYGYAQPIAPANTGPYAPQNPTNFQSGYAPAPSTYANTPYNPQNSLTQPPHLRPQQTQSAPIAPPPRGANGTPATGGPPAPPPKRPENGGWNDAPVSNATRGPAALNLNKPAAITSPFPNAAPSPGFSPAGSPYMNQGQATTNLPPPPRPGSVQARPPPPPQGQRIQGPPQPSHGRPPSRTAVPPQHLPPPARMLSPAQQGQPPSRQPTPGQYAPPPPRGPGPMPGQTPPPSQFSRPPPHGQQQPPAPGPYVREMAQTHPGPYDTISSPVAHQQVQHQGPYNPPPGSQRSGPSHQPPPPPQGVGAPPPGGPGGPPRTAPSASSRAQPPPPKYREAL